MAPLNPLVAPFYPRGSKYNPLILPSDPRASKSDYGTIASSQSRGHDQDSKSRNSASFNSTNGTNSIQDTQGFRRQYIATIHDRMDTLFKMQESYSAAIHHVRVSPPFQLDNGHGGPPEWSVQVSATLDPWPGKPYWHSVLGFGRKIGDAVDMAAEMMLRCLRNVKFSRRYYKDFPTFLDHLEIATSYVPFSRNPEKLLDFIWQMTPPQKTSMTEWTNQMIRAHRRNSRQYYSEEEAIKVCVYCNVKDGSQRGVVYHTATCEKRWAQRDNKRA